MANPVGKPKLIITQEQIDEVERLAGAGCTKKEIAHAIGLGYSTFFTKAVEYPELQEAFDCGRAKGTATASTNLMELVEAKYFPAIKFYLINRAEDRWSENPSLKRGEGTEDQAELLGQRMRKAFESARIIEGEVGPDE